MNYEQKYKSALEWMRSIYPTMQGADKEDAEHHFPELKESEDEKVRKELYKYFRDLQLSSDSEFSPSISIDEILAWLEKQKPDWSKEDEQNLKGIIATMEEDAQLPSDTIKRLCRWLKSIKPNHWKPSGFQLECLRRVIPHKDTEIDNELEYVLTELYEQLKQL